MDSKQKSGYFKAIEVLEELVDSQLQSNSEDRHTKRVIEEFIQMMLDKMDRM